MKRILTLGLVITLMFMLSACSGSKLADIYDKDEVIARAKEAVGVINTLDYEAINGLLREDLQDKLTADSIKETWDKKLTEAGKFVDYKSIATLGQKSKSTGEDYATVILTCTYENAALIYTITMDVNLDIVGMYMK